MDTITLTKKQRQLLEILDHYGGHGTIEVCIQFGEYEGRTDSVGWSLTQFVVGNLMRGLVKKGLATDADGYDITDSGRQLLKPDELCEGCYTNPCKCLPNDCTCDPQ